MGSQIDGSCAMGSRRVHSTDIGVYIALHQAGFDDMDKDLMFYHWRHPKSGTGCSTLR